MTTEDKPRKGLHALQRENDELTQQLHAQALRLEQQRTEMQGEIDALRKQWNDLDQRNELRHREWNAQLNEAHRLLTRLGRAYNKHGQLDDWAEEDPDAQKILEIMEKTDALHTQGTAEHGMGAAPAGESLQ